MVSVSGPASTTMRPATRAPRPLALLIALLAACGETTGSVVVVPAGLGGPLPSLVDPQRYKFERGVAFFDRVYTPEMGLGPLFNGRSCVECHNQPVRGGGGAQTGVHATAFRDGVCHDLGEVGGPVIQSSVTPALRDALGIEQEPIPAEATAIGVRTTPAIWGSGLLDAVPDSVLLALADPDDRDGDGVSGRATRALDGRVGRFGRKAQVASLWGFMAEGFAMEMGITNPLIPFEQTVAGRPFPPGVDPTPDDEIWHDSLSVADAFVRWSAPPEPDGPAMLLFQGRGIFLGVGCAACHTPELRTGAHPVAAVRDRAVPAYTDLLLHDMGPDLADICVGQALPEEFRTEPLWGLRFRSAFLHDGRATTIDAAIRLHAGEARGARERYLARSAEERTILLRFLESL